MLNNVDSTGEVYSSYSDYIEKIKQQLKRFKGRVDELVLNESDKKKLLALPFYLAKHTEMPEPKKGQKEWDLFTNLFGVEYDHLEDTKFDNEKKITEFDYEKFIHPEVLKHMDPKSDEFKREIRKQYLFKKTQMEQHDAN